MRRTTSRTAAFLKCILIGILALVASLPGAAAEERPARLSHAFRKARTLKGPADCAVFSLAFIGDGRDLVSSFSDDSVRVWNVANGKELWFTNNQRPGATGSIIVAASSDGRQFATLSGGKDESLSVWDANGRQPMKLRLQGFSVHSRALVFTPATDKVLTVGGNAVNDRESGEILSWNLATGKPTVLNSGDRGLISIDISPDGKTIVTGEYGPEVKVWDFATGAATHTWQSSHDGNEVAFSPDGTMIVSASIRDGAINVWALSRDEPVRLVEDHSAGVNGIAFVPRKAILAAASDDGVRLWEVASGRLVDLLKSGDDAATCLAFSADSRTLAVGSNTGVINIWQIDAPDGAENLIAEFEVQMREIENEAATKSRKLKAELFNALEKLRDAHTAERKYDDALAIHSLIRELQSKENAELREKND